MRRFAPLVLLVALAASACGGGGLPEGIKVAGAYGRRPSVTIPDTKAGRDLAVRTLREGKGPKVADGDLVAANYVGYRWNGKDHKLIASTYESGRPAMFPYGHLVTGLNKAMRGQRTGSRVMAVVPPSQGYGPNGYTPLQVNGDDTLVFVLDLIATFHNGVTAQGRPQPQGDRRLPQVTTGATPTMTIPATPPPSGLQIKTIIEGTGAPVTANQTVVYHDIGQVWRTRKVFESSRDRGHPDSVVVGAGQMISGWDRAVVGRPVGSRMLVVVPPKYGYGAQGHPSSGIKGGDTLAFVIDIIAAY